MRKFSYIFFSTLIILISYFAFRFSDLNYSKFLSQIFTVVIAIPPFYALFRKNQSRSAFVISALMVFAILFESSAILTGFPYGKFEYSDRLGFKLFGLVPWTVGFTWPPLVIGSCAIAVRYFDKNLFLQALVSAGILVIFDLILDPGAVAMGFWKWSVNGIYYSVPLSNFLGWYLSGFIGSWFLLKFHSFESGDYNYLISNFLISVIFWSGISVWTDMKIPFICGILLLLITRQCQKQCL